MSKKGKYDNVTALVQVQKKIIIGTNKLQHIAMTARQIKQLRDKGRAVGLISYMHNIILVGLMLVTV